MKYLITGITGFAGAHLAQLLFEKGHEVHGLVRGSNGMESDILDVVLAECFAEIKFHYGNLEDHRSLEIIFRSENFDGCFHLAAQSHPPTSFENPLDTFRTNINGTANLIDCIERFQLDCKLMFCSTSEVYGNGGKDGRKLTKADPLQPCNPYAVSKAAIDLYMQERMMNGKLQGFITRAFSHTGPRRGKNFSISSDAYQVARIIGGLQQPVIEVGNLDTVRVVIDVRDVVNAYYLLMQNPNTNGQIFNVCGDEPRKMEYFTYKLIELSGKGIKTQVSEKYYRKIDIHYQHGDSSMLGMLTGWKPEIPIEKTLDDLLNYWIKKIN